MLIFVTLAALLLAALGLSLVRTAPAVARWLAMLAAVAFAVVVSLADRTEGRDVPPRWGRAQLGGTAADERTAMLSAAESPRTSWNRWKTKPMSCRRSEARFL